MNLTKICCTCEIEKEINDFYKNKNLKDGYEYSCKQCRRDKMAINNRKEENIIRRRNWQDNFRKTHPEVVYNKARENRYRRLYNIGIEDYYSLLKEQDSKCAICGNPYTSKDRKTFDVDHCHETSIIRGLLCSNCNRGLGHFQDSIEILELAIKYLKKNKKDNDN